MKKLLPLFLLLWVVSACSSGSVWKVRADGESDATERIQKCLDECFLSGGGKVVICKGVYPVGGLRVRSNTTLYLKKGAVLSGSRDCSDYRILERETLESPDTADLAGNDVIWTPARTRLNGHAPHIQRGWTRWNDAIIRIYKAENVAVIGEKGSVIEGNNSYDPEGEERYRGVHGISVHKSRGLVFKGYCIRNTGNWAHNIRNCVDARFEDLEILGGHDGIHMQSSDSILIADCTMKTGDDCVAGFDLRDVVVARCSLNTACSAFRWGGTRLLAEDCYCYGPGEYIFRGSLTKQEKAEGASSGAKERRNMLGLFTYYADKTSGIREIPGNIVFRNIECKDVDRVIHYNFSGNEVWQLGGPLSSATFENVTVTGAKLPLCVYGDPARLLNLVFKNCRISFAEPVPELMRGAYVKKITVDGFSVEGVDGPFFRLWQSLSPELEIKGLEGIETRILPAEETFSVKPI